MLGNSIGTGEVSTGAGKIKDCGETAPDIINELSSPPSGLSESGTMLSLAASIGRIAGEVSSPPRDDGASTSRSLG
eukprot:CAMPEP_0169317874 /NCGR_PEP_ID=MMETSP1017-20121227/6960_1 /TAXON_ID=342587 /ORGANISM="Karlodinium micrum, Strain CCMP2283" /LENGTH=75 /DNA_ID=CAMNT_0009412061 /DNA_START=370 /DNA_END=597 /DNA_ORIENTATION=+